MPFRPSQILSAGRLIATQVIVCACLITAPLATAGAGPAEEAKVYAVYDITFNGFRLGKFKLHSDINDRRYAMKADSKFSLLSGLLFEWKGFVESHGAMKGGDPKPAAYSFQSDVNGKVERLNIKFARNAVDQVVSHPPHRPSSKRVPLREEHLHNVVDPMSALMLLTKSDGRKVSGKEVCNRQLAVFDGEQRFNLTLSYKKLERLEKSANNGFSGPAYVCRVKYRPLAGHKPSKSSIQFMAETNDIEVWLVPVHKAKMYMPYRIVLPTVAGYATATSSVFQIDRPGRGRIAFAR